MSGNGAIAITNTFTPSYTSSKYHYLGSIDRCLSKPLSGKVVEYLRRLGYTIGLQKKTESSHFLTARQLSFTSSLKIMQICLWPKEWFQIFIFSLVINEL